MCIAGSKFLIPGSRFFPSSAVPKKTCHEPYPHWIEPCPLDFRRLCVGERPRSLVFGESSCRWNRIGAAAGILLRIAGETGALELAGRDGIALCDRKIHHAGQRRNRRLGAGGLGRGDRNRSGLAGSRNDHGKGLLSNFAAADAGVFDFPTTALHQRWDAGDPRAAHPGG